LGATVTRQSSEPHDVNVEAWNIDAFSARLREAMNGRTPYSIQKETGIAQSLIGKYMKGLSTPGIDKLVLLANTLGVSVAWLASGEGEPSNAPEAGQEGLREEGVLKAGDPGAEQVRAEELQGYFQQAREMAVEDAKQAYSQPTPLPTVLYARLAGPLAQLASEDEGEREWVLERTVAIVRAATLDDPVDMLHLDSDDLRNAVELAVAAFVMEKDKEEHQRRALLATSRAAARFKADENDEDTKSQETQDALDQMKGDGNDGYF